MPTLREEIRAILREELAALRLEPRQRVEETVRIASSEDLTRFAQDLVSRAVDPDFAAQLRNGQLRFVLADPARMLTGPTVANPDGPAMPMLDKKLVTERDIAELGRATRTIRLSKHSRLTPLARDEARRIGLRVERNEA
ncbi:MAG: hypothetical protein AAF982_01705 [Pseudomonadota bacterium]